MNRSPVCRRPHAPSRADAQGQRSNRLSRHLSPGGAPVYRKADRAGQQFRQPGCDCDRERPPAQRAARAHGELARSVEELRALGDVSQAVNSTLDLATVLSTIVSPGRPTLRHRSRRDLRVRRAAGGIAAALHLRHERGVDHCAERSTYRARRANFRAGSNSSRAGAD